MRFALLFLLSCFFAVQMAMAKEYTPADFARGNELYSAKISPTGEYLAVGMIQNEQQVLTVLDAKTFEPVGGARFARPKQVGTFHWVNDERLVIQLVESRPWEHQLMSYGELYAVNYDGSKPEIIYGYSAGESTAGTRVKKRQSTLGWAEIESLLPGDEEHILIRSTPMSNDGARLPTLEKINVYTGMMKKVTTSPVPGGNFLVDGQGKPRYLSGVDKDLNILFYELDPKSNEWLANDKIKMGTEFGALAFDNDDKGFYYINNHEGDFTGLFKFNIETGESNNIYTDEAVDITDLSFNQDLSGVYAIRVDDGYPAYLIFNKEYEEAQVFRSLLSTFAGAEVTVTSSTDDYSKWIVYVASDTSAGAYYLFDRKAMQVKLLFKMNSGLVSSEMAVSTPYKIKARDGMEIPVYLTLPEKAKGPVPLITLVHGGPHGVRDYWSFDSEVQMLANEGYAVLRVNFRGSDGYGQSFAEAGMKHWGDAIQHDIIDATNWAREKAEIDGDKVCIMGASFGGYSALQSSILAPDVFDCAVANAGVYDLQNLFEDGDIPEGFWGASFLESVLGTDKAQLTAFSPTHNVEKLKTPVLIAHGKKDRRAPFSQAQALRKAMDKADKDYEWFVRDSETHGFYDEENRGAYFKEVVDFLADHLD